MPNSLTSLPLYQVDAFTQTPFAGNPAAVCVLPEKERSPSHINDAWMQNLAAEMNLSETAFLQPLSRDSQNQFLIRWFTPAAEVELCGHATLASAHILYQTERHPEHQPLHFQTLHAGQLTCSLTTHNQILMDFPADTPQPLPIDQLPSELITHLNITSAEIVNAFKNSWDILLELKSESLVRNLTPNFHALAQFASRGIAVTAAADPNTDYDFVSRFFAPALRINEDPVTGSLHCVLAPYWAKKLNKNPLVAYQASSRGGLLNLHCKSHDNKHRIEIAGHATTIFNANLIL
ncbi:putative isomerase YddE [Poriferisphaera corsica]|uniref:Putative isomerase YddE n=1 Tax=Poriferisphaera corsica TaxID=2528020 RepID=A0A517YP61_9BACT|nr:PhzF family phenazine biosynthesis protein [Poriferisphaera corsica]QDU32003.1 putative isomerase YddE [Poriferisphaera corsica]